MINTLLNHFHPGKESYYYKYFSEKLSKKLKQYPLSIPFSIASWQLQETIHRMHYSWLEPIFKKKSSFLTSYFLNFLSSAQVGGLTGLLDRKESKLELKAHIEPYFFKLFCEEIEDKEVVPIDFLPKSSLNILVALKKQQLVNLIDLLGLHDLAISMRQVVDRAIIDAIYAQISPLQRQYLRFCLQLQEIPVLPIQPIQQWLSDLENFQRKIHFRGIFRFSIALIDQSYSLKWYISRCLDIGRGKQFLKFSSPEAALALQTKQKEKFIHQVAHLAQLLKTQLAP